MPEKRLQRRREAYRFDYPNPMAARMEALARAFTAEYLKRLEETVWKKEPSDFAVLPIKPA